MKDNSNGTAARGGVGFVGLLQLAETLQRNHMELVGGDAPDHYQRGDWRGGDSRYHVHRPLAIR